VEALQSKFGALFYYLTGPTKTSPHSPHKPPSPPPPASTPSKSPFPPPHRLVVLGVARDEDGPGGVEGEEEAAGLVLFVRATGEGGAP